MANSVRWNAVICKGTASGSSDPVQAARIERYKSGKYTVERPLHLGAALAGRLDELADPLSAFGLPLGEAFQLRDDILGVFGDAAVTGKPVGDDLREGKLTPLLAAATAVANESQAALLARAGSPELGADENSSRDAGLVIAEVRRLIERYHCVVLVIHHEGKNRRRGPRGASASSARSRSRSR